MRGTGFVFELMERLFLPVFGSMIRCAVGFRCAARGGGIEHRMDLDNFFFLDRSCSINRAEWKRGLNVGAKQYDSGARILSFDHWGRDLGERCTSSL